MTPWIDAHLDLAYLAVNGRDLRRPLDDGADGCITLPALREAGVDLIFATIFTEPEADPAEDPAGYRTIEEAHTAGRRQLDVYRELEAAAELTIVRTRTDLGQTAQSPRIVILMEGADPIRTPGEAAWWWNQGVRLVGLTWSRGTQYAGGNATTKGLSTPGLALVDRLDELGVVHDASHLSDPAFATLLDRTRGPVVASHSNCRAITADDQRHLTDEQIITIGDRDGVVGLNLYTRFLHAERRATAEDAADHVERVTGIMGHRRGVGLGSDMDGGFDASGLPEDVDHPSRLERLTEVLGARGWTEPELAGFRHDNWRTRLESWLPE